MYQELRLQHIFWEHTIQPTIPGMPQSSNSSQIAGEALAQNTGRIQFKLPINCTFHDGK